MNILVKKLSEEAVIPQRAKESDAGFDLVAIDNGFVGDDGYIQYRTGLSIQVPDGYHTEIWPRSSISKYDVVLANSIGLVDNGYRGEILIRFKSVIRLTQNYETKEITKFDSNSLRLYKKGDKIAQLVVAKTIDAVFVESNELSETSRGSGGFGSTGS